MLQDAKSQTLLFTEATQILFHKSRPFHQKCLHCRLHSAEYGVGSPLKPGQIYRAQKRKLPIIFSQAGQICPCMVVLYFLSHTQQNAACNAAVTILHEKPFKQSLVSVGDASLAPVGHGVDAVLPETVVPAQSTPVLNALHHSEAARPVLHLVALLLQTQQHVLREKQQESLYGIGHSLACHKKDSFLNHRSLPALFGQTDHMKKPDLSSPFHESDTVNTRT